MLLNDVNDSLNGSRLLRDYLKSTTQKASPKVGSAIDSQTLENTTDIRLTEVIVNDNLNKNQRHSRDNSLVNIGFEKSTSQEPL